MSAIRSGAADNSRRFRARFAGKGPRPEDRPGIGIPCGSIRSQAGLTLIEAIIALALSALVTSAMVVLMANSLGTATDVIQMTQLTDELRTAMHMVTRDVRRANYSAHAAYCFANSDCGSDGSATQAPDLVIDPDTEDCLVFNLDRDQDGDASTDNAGGVRFRLTADGVGFLELWVGDATASCEPLANRQDDPDWLAVTDPDFMDVTSFTVDDAESFTATLVEEGGSVLTQRSREVLLALEGRLLRDDQIVRRIEDVIKVRNDIFL